MAENSGFFDAHLVNGEYDRVYLAEQFAKYFASFIGNGIFGGKSSELIVKQKETAAMSVRVMPGQGFINGYWYENTNEASLAIDVADGVLNRIDVIALRWYKSERVIRLAVIKGTPASSPSVPNIIRSQDYYDLKLAEVYVRAGATSIIQANITDTRLNTSVCGLVQGVIQQFDTTEFGITLDSFIKNFETYNTNKMNEVLAKLNAMADDNDVASLILDIQNLQAFHTESTEYPGCYYRLTTSGEKEWVNPPDELGVEYRTTERFRGEVLYKKTIWAASLPNNSTMVIQTGIPGYNVISVEGRMLDTDENFYYPIPYCLPNQTIPTTVISSIEYDGELYVYSALDTRHCEGFFTIKYKKS